jgi:hypothetical protein
MKQQKLWGGFIDGKLDVRWVDTGFGGYGSTGFRWMPVLFTSYRAAKEQYEDVRRVDIPVRMRGNRVKAD